MASFLGTRVGKRWIFLREDVVTFLKEKIAKDVAGSRDIDTSKRSEAALRKFKAKMAPGFNPGAAFIRLE
jgi:hypothetical protein